MLRNEKMDRYRFWRARDLCLALLFLLALGGAACGKTAPDKPGPTKQVVLQMKGMTCNGCVRALTGAFQKVKGAKTVKVTLKPPQAVIAYDSAKASPKRFILAAEKLGYGASVTRDGPFPPPAPVPR